MKPGRPKSGPSKPKLSDHGINPETVEEHPNEKGEPQADIITHTTGNIFCFSTDNVVLDNKQLEEAKFYWQKPDAHKRES